MRLLQGYYLLLLAYVANCNLLVQRKFDPKYFVLGKSTKVTLALYNVGEEAISNVKVEDSFFSSGSGAEFFQVIEGSSVGSFADIAPKTDVEFSFTVKPLALGEIKDEPALVTYSLESDKSQVNRGLSSSPVYFVVLSEIDYQANYAEHSKQWAIFYLLLAGPVGIPFLAFKYLESRKHF